MRRITGVGNPAGWRGIHHHPISIYEMVAVHKQTHLFMGAEDRQNSVANTWAYIFGSTCPEGFRDRNRLNSSNVRIILVLARKVTYMIGFLSVFEEEVIEVNRRERWQIIELKKKIAGESRMIYGRTRLTLKNRE